MIGTSLDHNLNSGSASPFTKESKLAFQAAWDAAEFQSLGRFTEKSFISSTQNELTEEFGIDTSLSISFMKFSVCASLFVRYKVQTPRLRACSVTRLDLRQRGSGHCCPCAAAPSRLASSTKCSGSPAGVASPSCSAVRAGHPLDRCDSPCTVICVDIELGTIPAVHDSAPYVFAIEIEKESAPIHSGVSVEIIFS